LTRSSKSSKNQEDMGESSVRLWWWIFQDSNRFRTVALIFKHCHFCLFNSTKWGLWTGEKKRCALYHHVGRRKLTMVMLYMMLSTIPARILYYGSWFHFHLKLIAWDVCFLSIRGRQKASGPRRRPSVGAQSATTLATTRQHAQGSRCVPFASSPGTTRLLVLRGKVLAWELEMSKYVHFYESLLFPTSLSLGILWGTNVHISTVFQ
jgi:hypothetical protein